MRFKMARTVAPEMIAAIKREKGQSAYGTRHDGC